MGRPFEVTVERKSLLMCEPHLMSFVHMMKNEWTDDPNMIACTDGDSVWYGQEYADMKPPERAYVYVHELLHGILRHPDRAMLKRLAAGTLNPSLWNYAGDAIINESIDANRAMPSGMFTHPEKFPPVLMKMIHSAIKEAVEFSGETAPSNYDPKAKNGQQIEVVYGWLMWAHDAVRRNRKQSEGESGQGQPGSGEPESGGGTMIERMAREPAWDLIEQLEKLQEILDKGESPTTMIDEINRRMEEAKVKIEQVVQGLKLQGKGQGSLLLELVNDLPLAVVPWNRHLRKVVTRGMGTKLNDSYTRYGINTLFGLVTRQKNIQFSPGTTIYTERPRILVILDVSGSHISMLTQCFAEIWSIAAQKGAVVEVMTFDDGVQQTIVIDTIQDLKKLLREGIRGGGGTSLSSVFDDASKLRDPYRAVIVMTDGYLTQPKKPKFGVIWLITPGGRDEFTYGEKIYLPDYMNKVLDKKAA